MKDVSMKKYLSDLKAFMAGVAKAGVVTFLFYKSVVITLVLGILYGILNIRMDRKRRREKWRWQINLEFREVLTGISSALNAGYSIENAFLSSKDDLVFLYGDKSLMVKELVKMSAQLSVNKSLENVLMEFAEYSGVEDVYNFAEVFQTAKRTGGNLIDVARTTSEKISTKIEVKREIQTMISGKQMECKVMNLIPLGIILYFWIASPGFLDCMYTMSGRPVMTVLMIVYIAAFKWSERIGDITV